MLCALPRSGVRWWVRAGSIRSDTLCPGSRWLFLAFLFSAVVVLGIARGVFSALKRCLLLPRMLLGFVGSPSDSRTLVYRLPFTVALRILVYVSGSDLLVRNNICEALLFCAFLPLLRWLGFPPRPLSSRLACWLPLRWALYGVSVCFL